MNRRNPAATTLKMTQKYNSKALRLTYYIVITIRNSKSLVVKLGEDILKYFKTNTVYKADEVTATEV